MIFSVHKSSLFLTFLSSLHVVFKSDPVCFMITDDYLPVYLLVSTYSTPMNVLYSYGLKCLTTTVLSHRRLSVD